MADTTMVEALVRLTMNPMVPIMVAGDLATTWRRFAAKAVVHMVAAATHLHHLIDPRLLPARCRLFRRMAVAVAAVVVAADDVNRSLKN
jgi:hypothetical protein